MPNIIHRISSVTTREQLYNAVATREGLSSWFTSKVSGEYKAGSIIKLGFSRTGPDFHVLKLQHNKKVEWKCVRGPREWIDTHVEFFITEAKGDFILLFKHSGWREEIEFMYHCNTQWAYSFLHLKKFVETGKAPSFRKKADPFSWI